MKYVRECPNCGMKFENKNVTICLKCGSVTNEIESKLKRESFREKTIEKNEPSEN